MARKPQVKVRAVQSFQAAAAGRTVMVAKGDVFLSSDPVVQGREKLFIAADTERVRTTADTDDRGTVPPARRAVKVTEAAEAETEVAVDEA